MRGSTSLREGPVCATSCAAIAFACVAACSSTTSASPSADSCAAATALESRADIDATPRADADAELLALLFGDRVTADDSLYARVSADLAAIRALDPSLGDLRVRVAFDAERISLLLADAASAKSRHDWDCLNAHYGLVRADVSVWASGDGYASLQLKGRYATDLVACRYAHLPFVARAYAGGYDGDGSGVFGYADADGATFHYVFDRASGDCPSGCTNHDARHFTSDARRAITERDHFEGVGVWPWPDWLIRARQGRERACPSP